MSFETSIKKLEEIAKKTITAEERNKLTGFI